MTWHDPRKLHHSLDDGAGLGSDCHLGPIDLSHLDFELAADSRRFEPAPPHRFALADDDGRCGTIGIAWGSRTHPRPCAETHRRHQCREWYVFGVGGRIEGRHSLTYLRHGPAVGRYSHWLQEEQCYGPGPETVRERRLRMYANVALLGRAPEWALVCTEVVRFAPQAPYWPIEDLVRYFEPGRTTAPVERHRLLIRYPAARHRHPRQATIWEIDLQRNTTRRRRHRPRVDELPRPLTAPRPPR